jgi:hypothetical protein
MFTVLNGMVRYLACFSVRDAVLTFESTSFNANPESFVSRASREGVRRVLVTVAVPVFIVSTSVTNTAKKTKDAIGLALQSSFESGELMSSA